MTAGLGELRRILGPLTGAAICVGMAIGAGILRTPGEIAAQLPSAWWIFGVWTLGAVIASIDALILAEMASSVPRVGGLVAYVHLSFGRRAAFLVGWSMLLVTWPAALALVALTTGELVTGGIETLAGDASSSPWAPWVAIAVIAICAVANVVGLRFGAGFEVVLFVAKVVLLGGVCIAAMLAAPAVSEAVVAEPRAMPTTFTGLLVAIGASMTAVIFSYDGYADAVYVAGETKDPGRALPRALFGALAVITALYLLANATFLHVLGVQGLAASQFPALDVVRRAFGDSGGTLLQFVVIVVLLGSVNAYFLSGPRIARILAEEGLAVPVLGRVGATGSSPASIVLVALLAMVFALTNQVQQLLDITVPIMAATTALVAVGLLVQRHRAPERPRPFRVPLAPLFVGLQVVLGGALLASFLASNAYAIAIDAGALAVGVVAYELVKRRGAR